MSHEKGEETMSQSNPHEMSRVIVDVEQLKKEMVEVKTKQQIQDVKIEVVEKRLEKIDSNTTWILRLVVGAIILYIINYFLKGSTVKVSGQFIEQLLTLI